MTSYRIAVAALAAAAFSALGASSAFAETFSVTNTAQLEAAVTSANATPGANTIVVAAGAYTPEKTLEFTNTSGLQTVIGPTTPEAKLEGGAVEPFPSEFFIINAGVSVALDNVVVSTGGGSGVPAISDFGSLTIEGSLISGNNGAGVVVNPAATATVVNSTLSDGLDFGMDNAGTASFVNSTVAFNALGGISNEGTLNLTNTIVAENGLPNCSKAAATSDHSLDSDGSCGVGALSNVNPLLSALVNNGGPTPTHLLQIGSPAIDAGDPAACPATDERGFARPDIAETACDIGATEYYSTPPTITVPENITAAATSPSGAAVTYKTSATSTVAKVASVACTPASGSTFAAGQTTVTCTATDEQGNTATGTFIVTVLGVSPQILNLETQVRAAALAKALSRPLSSDLTKAAKALTGAKPSPAKGCEDLSAFISLVEANTATIGATNSSLWIKEATQIRAVAGC